MDLLADLFKKRGDIKHAYHLIGALPDVSAQLENLRVSMGEGARENLDYHLYKKDVFGIDDARDVGARVSKKSLTGRKFFVIAALTITREAQNALLKTVEDAGEENYFFVCTRTADTLLPTLRSRLVQLAIHKETTETLSSESSEFLAKNVSGRMEFVRKIIDADDRQKALSFLDALEYALSSAVLKNPIGEPHLYEGFAGDIRNARARIIRKEGNLRLLLEQVALASLQVLKK